MISQSANADLWAQADDPESVEKVDFRRVEIDFLNFRFGLYLYTCMYICIYLHTYIGT
jgi:hypothetical protein